MTSPERKLVALEVLVAVLALVVVVLVIGAAWWFATTLPAGISLVLTAAPLGAAVRLAPAVPALPHRLRVWHATTLARWLASATARRWDSPPAR